jgi:CubicO group peptidase (beta-lactamase class C family)
MLAEPLARIASQLSANYVHLGMYQNNAEAEVTKYHRPDSASSGTLLSHPVLCSIKLLTAALVSVIAQTHRLDLHSNIAELGPTIHPSTSASFNDIQVAHLLAHSHGLADTLSVDPASTTPIPSLFSPGSFYSYGATGYMLLGRVLEAICQRRFEELLYQVVLERIASAESRRLYSNAVLRGVDTRVCPATGAGLALALDDLLAFARVFTGDQHDIVELTPSRIKDMLQSKAPMPGWSPFIRGSCYGFRDFGNGWYGHNGISRRHLTYFRINPARGSAICLVANGTKDNIGMLPAMVLKERFPELVAVTDSQPTIDTDKVLDGGHPVLGTYSDFLFRYRIAQKGGRLKLEIAEQAAGTQPAIIVHECFLYPAGSEIYFLSKPWKKVTFVQHIRRREDGACYLWNADQTIPKLVEMT